MGNQEVVQINFGVAVVSRASRYEVGPAGALDATRQAKDTPIVRKVNASIPDRQGQGFFTATKRGHGTFWDDSARDAFFFPLPSNHFTSDTHICVKFSTDCEANALCTFNN